MAASRGLRRLLRMLEIEEEQHRTMLAAAIADLRRLEAAWDAAKTRDREGRRLVVASAVTNQLADRLAGLEETRVAQRKAAALQPRMVDGQAGVNARRQEFLLKRTERRQAETLIEETEAREKREDERRAQSRLDERFLSRMHHGRKT